MRKYLLVIIGLIFFLAGGFFLEEISYFYPLKKNARRQTVPMGILDYGSLGNILKQLSVVKTVPVNNSRVVQSNENQLYQNMAQVKITIETNNDTKFQIYWAKSNREYGEMRSSTVQISNQKEIYYLYLSNLKSIQKLRIDPADKPSTIILKSILITQKGYTPIHFATPNNFKKLKPLKDIQEISRGKEGFSLMTLGNDAQLEVFIFPRKRFLHTLLFPKKRREGEYLYGENRGGADEFPSSKAVKEEYLKDGVSLISIVTDEDNLYSKEKGIIYNWQRKGADWERLAYVSYYENKKLIFATSAGLRLHGKSTREAGINFRLYFKRKYGMKELLPGTIFDLGTHPIKRLVITSDRSNPGFNNAIAFDIARAIGGLTPEIKPAIFLLNGKRLTDTAYFLIEHLSERQWANHIGHDDFVFLRLGKKQDNLLDDRTRYNLLKERFKNKNIIRLQEVKKYIDVDNLSRWIIATVFCGNWDFEQGAAVLDKTEENSKWFWIMWDMDISFFSHKRWPYPGELWQQRGFPLTLQNEFRMEIFKYLMANDHEYNKYFSRLLMDILNHKINSSFLKSRVDHYEKLSKTMFGSEPYFDSMLMRDFFEKRPDQIRNELRKYYGIYGIGESLRSQVNGPDGIKFLIDGYPEEPGYEGWYFKGETIDIKVVSQHQSKFSHWMVNGEKIRDRRLIFPINRKTVIEPILSTENYSDQ